MGNSQQTPGTRTQKAFVIDSENGRTITVAKLYSKGERLKISCEGESVKLDALLLESLSWQRERGVLDEVIDSKTNVACDPVPITGGERVDGNDPISISNEYSHTSVSKVETANGDALRIDTPGRGTAINLGAETLATLTQVEKTFVFSTWFKTPFGPEDAPLEGPL